MYPFLRGINMPYCNKCGFQVAEEMQFCPNCGAPLRTQRSFLKKPASTAKLGAKPVLIRMTPFTNGIFIGLGAAILIGGFLGAVILNLNYWFLRDYFMASGLESQQIRYLLRMTVTTIGFCAAFVPIGIFAVAAGTLSQVNPAIRAAFNRGEMKARWGSGLLAAGLVFAGSSVRGLVQNFYSPESFWFWSSIAFGIASIILLLIGFFLIATARSE